MVVYGETKEKLKATAEKLSIPVTVVETLEEAVPKPMQQVVRVEIVHFHQHAQVGINLLTSKCAAIVSLKQ